VIETKTTAAEYRALGRLMRHARAEGYTYRISSAFGRTDWSWGKANTYAVVAEPLAVGWKVTFDDGRADLWPASVQQLTDVLVALGLLPPEFAITFTLGRCAAATDVERMPINLGDEGWEALTRLAADAGYDRRLVTDRRRRDDFTTDTIETAYQYGYRSAAKVAKSGGAA
jgi:hypothetical protein